MRPKGISIILSSKLGILAIPDVIEAIYLYGSFVKGNIRTDSDIDIAVLISHEANDFEKLQLISKMEGIFTSLFREMGFQHEVGILDLKGKYVPFQLQYRVITKGKAVYTGNLLSRLEFENMVKREYFDFSPYLKFLRERKYGYLLQKA